MKAPEEPDEKDDRDRYTDQPKQKTSTHNFLLLIASQPNVGSELKFHGPSRPVATPRMAGQYGTTSVRDQTLVWRVAASSSGSPAATGRYMNP
jgi:hypothetical protein